MKTTNYYYSFEHLLQRCTDSISCSFCNRRMLLKAYQKHCKLKHHLNPLTCCVFCKGKKTWRHGEKRQMGKHLCECVSAFINFNKCINSVEKEKNETEVVEEKNETKVVEEKNETKVVEEKNATPLICSESCFAFCPDRPRSVRRPTWNDHDWNVAGVRLMEEPLFESEPERLDFTEEDVWRQWKGSQDKEKWLALLNPLKFDRQSGLGNVHVWIKRYLYTSWVKRNDALHYTWYHLCVRAGCMNSFYRAMDGITLVATPYWCVCDAGVGLNNPGLQTRLHHRHFVVAVKNPTRFHKALRHHVSYDGSGDPPERGFKKYYAKRIKDANHFVTTVAYVSMPRSRCKCKQLLETGDERIVRQFSYLPYKNVRHEGHYVIANRMVPHCRWRMLLMIPSGGIDRFAQFSIGPRSILGMESRCRLGNKTTWKVSAAEEFQIQNCVVDPPNLQIDSENPIRDDLQSLVSTPFVYWFDGKIYPVRPMEMPTFDDDNTFQEWHAKNGINTLLNLRGGSLFSLSVKLQRHANDLFNLEMRCKKKASVEQAIKIKELNVEHNNEMEKMRLELKETKDQDINLLKLQNKLEISEINCRTYKTNYANCKKEYGECKKDYEQCKKDYGQCKKDYEQCKKEYNKCKKDNEKLKNKYEQLQNDRFSALETDFENCKMEKQRLETELKNYNENLIEFALQEIRNNYSFLINQKLPSLKSEMKKYQQQKRRKRQATNK